MRNEAREEIEIDCCLGYLVRHAVIATLEEKLLDCFVYMFFVFFIKCTISNYIIYNDE